jgi:predicted esterase
MVSFTDTNAPATNGRSLFFSLHGGGGAPPAVNDSQWRNQVRLAKGYHPREGIYLAPRAPTDAWNLWHQAHIDVFFDRFIENLVVLSNVNPNRVYVFGYSAGGDGVYQVAPRTADRWAGAAMMAGHPNEASPLGLRNVPFAIQVGANDGGYGRNKVAAEWGRQLDELQRADPAGYLHFTELHAGKGHWMDLEDRKAIPWMEKFTRTPLPNRLVWFQDDVAHTRFYWLARPPLEVKKRQTIVAQRAGQTVTLSSTNVHTVTVLLNDALLDLDQPVVIRAGEASLHEGRLPRTVATLARTLGDRGDTHLTFSAEVTVTLP